MNKKAIKCLDNLRNNFIGCGHHTWDPHYMDNLVLVWKVFKHCMLARQRKMDTNWSLSKLSWSLICPCSYNSVKHWFYFINYSDSEITNVHERRWLELKLKILRSVYKCNTLSSTVLSCSRTCIYIYGHVDILTFKCMTP